MWRYKPMNIPYDQSIGDSKKLPELYFVVGNYDGKKGFVIDDIVMHLDMQGTIGFQSVMPVSTSNPNVISLYVQEHAVPAYQIDGIDRYYHDFKNLSDTGNFYFFSDKRFEKLAPDIFPTKGDAKALRIWTIGFFTGLIFNQTQGYYIKSKSGKSGTKVKCFDADSPKGKNNRVSAFEYFYESDIFANEISEKFDKMLDRDKPKLIAELLEYFHIKMDERSNLGKFKTSLESEEEVLLHNERKMIVNIGLDDLNMHSRDFIKPGLEGDELEEHKDVLIDLGAEEV
jgi:hypothetical protein